jgi:beta-galactosidase
MKQHWLLGLLVAVGIVVVLFPAVLCWHTLRPWQHMVNLDYFYQTKIASASPHDRNPRNNLARLPAGRRTFDGVRFNVAGLIQLADENDVAQKNNPYPESVEGIPVNRVCRQLHLLHGTVQGLGDPRVVASLVLHYADGTTGKLDIVYGQQVYDWWFKGSADMPLAGNTKVAWVGQNPEAANGGYRIRVFKSSFDNPKPDLQIKTIDYVSALTASGPFLLALTVE